MKTKHIEIVSIGNGVQCSVNWREVLINESTRRIGIVTNFLQPVKTRRENRITYSTFEVPEGVICEMHRRVCVNPRTSETRLFWINNGEYEDLGMPTAAFNIDTIYDRKHPGFKRMGGPRILMERFVRGIDDDLDTVSDILMQEQIKGRHVLSDTKSNSAASTQVGGATVSTQIISRTVVAED